MAETTSIEITREQKDRLDNLKQSQWEPYKSVVERLIEAQE